MVEPTPDMLPDVPQQEPQSETKPAPTPEVTETVSQDVKTVSDEPGIQEDAPETPESNVPSGHVPWSRFKEEQKKRKELEKQLQDLQASSTEEEISVEPEQTPDIEAIQQELKDLKMDKFLNQYPELNDKREELDEYLEKNSDLSLDRAVNLFRVEYGLIGTSPARKGLEKVVAGPKSAPTPKWSLEQIDELRLTDEKRYQKLMEQGAFDETLQKAW